MNHLMLLLNRHDQIIFKIQSHLYVLDTNLFLNPLTNFKVFKN